MKKNIFSNDFYEKLVFVNRISKTVKGGRVFSFSALTVVGNKKGKVGYGYGKAKEVPLAIQKSLDKSKRNMIDVLMNKNRTIKHEIKAKYISTIVFMKPASSGTGIIASKSMMAVFKAVGIKDILAKIYGSNNPINIVKATIKALSLIKSPYYIACKRGKFLKEILF